MGAGRDGARRSRRDAGSSRRCRRAAGRGPPSRRARADGAEDVGPLVAGVARRSGPGAAPCPDPGERALLADPASSWNQTSSGLPRPPPGSPRLPPRGSFFERRLGLRIGLRVLRPHREPGVAERRQVLAHRPLLQLHPEAPRPGRCRSSRRQRTTPSTDRIGPGLQPGPSSATCSGRAAVGAAPPRFDSPASPSAL